MEGAPVSLFSVRVTIRKLLRTTIVRIALRQCAGRSKEERRATKQRPSLPPTSPPLSSSPSPQTEVHTREKRRRKQHRTSIHCCSIALIFAVLATAHARSAVRAWSTAENQVRGTDTSQSLNDSSRLTTDSALTIPSKQVKRASSSVLVEWMPHKLGQLRRLSDFLNRCAQQPGPAASTSTAPSHAGVPSARRARDAPSSVYIPQPRGQELPARLRTAREEAAVSLESKDTLPLRRFPGPNENCTTRALGRQVALGVKRLPPKEGRIEMERLGNQKQDALQARYAPKPLVRRKPDFRLRYSTSAQAAAPATAYGESAQASTSAVTIEDAVLLDMQERRLSPVIDDAWTGPGSPSQESVLEDAEVERPDSVEPSAGEVEPRAEHASSAAGLAGDTGKKRRGPSLRGPISLAHRKVMKGRSSMNPLDQVWPRYIPEAKHAADLVGILRRTLAKSSDRVTLDACLQLHDRHASMASTASYNVLLQYLLKTRDQFRMKSLLTRMDSTGIKRDAVTWDIWMESLSGKAKWPLLVDAYEARQAAGVLLTAQGWTRIAQAATRNGTTSLTDAAIEKSMSPIYGAMYHLPRGARSEQLRYMARMPQTDVDQLLAAMMPTELSPLDFQATLVVAHRLAKQRRWREAEDVAANWQDRAEQHLKLMAHALASISTSDAERNPAPEGGADAGSEHQQLQAKCDAFRSLLATRTLALLHVSIEGLVVNRSPPAAVRAYLESSIDRQNPNLPLRPTYQTIFLVLTSFRTHRLRERFAAAMDALKELEGSLKPNCETLADVYARSRCIRCVRAYALRTLESFETVQHSAGSVAATRARALVEETRLRLKHLDKQSEAVEEALSQQVRTPIASHSDEQAQHVHTPERHNIVKELWRQQRLEYKAARIQDAKVAQVRAAKREKRARSHQLWRERGQAMEDEGLAALGNS